MTRILPAALLLSAATIACDKAPDDTAGRHDTAADDGRDAFTEPQIDAVDARLHEDFGSLVLVTWEQLEPARVWGRGSAGRRGRRDRHRAAARGRAHPDRCERRS